MNVHAWNENDDARETRRNLFLGSISTNEKFLKISIASSSLYY